MSDRAIIAAFDRVVTMPALNLPSLPDHPAADPALRARYLGFLQQYKRATSSSFPVLQVEAKSLARDLRHVAFELDCERGTRYSAETEQIYSFYECAAVVALLAFGSAAAEFASHERDVMAYKDDRRLGARVAAFMELRNARV